VFGILWTLLSGSAFANGASRAFPRATRPLMWIGYLVLSLAIFNWIEVTHTVDSAPDTLDEGFFRLGIPLAAWLWMRRPFASPTAETSTVAPRQMPPAPAPAEAE
jgi:hypothetical protein